MHARRRTPVNSILFVGTVTLCVGLASIVGVGEQEAFQLLNNGAGIFYALTYLVMFALPILGVRGVERRAPLWLRLAAGSAFLMTLLYVVLSIFPIVRVRSQFGFTAKILGLILLSNVLGTAIFLVAERRRPIREIVGEDRGQPPAEDADRARRRQEADRGTPPQPIFKPS